MVIGLLFFGLFGFSQNALVDSEYGSIIQTYLNQNQSKYRLVPNDIEDLYVNKEYFSKSTKINHVYVNQRYQGIEIQNAISSVAIRDNAVFYYANNLIGNISQKVNTISPQISAQRAIENVVAQLNLGSLQDLQLISGNNKEFLFTNGNVSKVNIPVKLVYTLTEQDELKLSWDLSIHTKGGDNWWSVRVDAISGVILDKGDWVVSCNFGDGNHANHANNSNHDVVVQENFSLFKTNAFVEDGSHYNVYAFPTEAPSFGDRTLLSSPADDNASPFGWQDTNGIAGAEYTITRGNNVYAYEDSGDNDVPGASPDGTASLNFDFPLNFNQEPVGYQDASLTNLFYVNNVMHDVYYQYGFDEASGNFQENNYSNGGLGGDSVDAEGQDGGGLNNANFGTPPDGQNPYMQMYLWAPTITGYPTNLVTVNNSSVMGGYQAANPATAAPNNITGIGTTPVTADLMLVDDGTALPTEGCNPIASVAGKIAVIRRGTCPFVDKIQNAQDAGAVGVIVVNHNNPTNDPAYVQYISMAGTTNPVFTIPSVFMNYEYGELLIAAMETETLNVTLQAPAYYRDGSLDNGVIAHEYGHGISNRLTGGPSAAGCLQNAEQMGEGWSDWFGLMLTIQPGAQPEDPRTVGTYDAGQSPNGPGFRPAPYSTDFAINDFTYVDTNNTALTAPHGVGFVWATMIWDLSWAYIEKYGFDPDVYYGTGGNNKAMQIVMDGLKLQACSPGFVTGRDAILAADMALTGGEDQCMIWEVFARRGLGYDASEGSTYSRTDQVESFTMPPENDPSLDNCTSLSVEEFNSSSYKVYPNPTNSRLFIKTAKNYGEVTLTLTDLNGRQVLSTKVELLNEVEIDVNRLQSGIYILSINGQSINANHKIIKN